MRKKYYILGGVAALFIVFILALLPWIDGFIFKRQYVKFIAAVAQLDPQTKIEVVEYRQGWFNSSAKVEVLLPINNIPTFAASPMRITLDEQISHGPLVHNPISDSKTFALAAIRGTVYLPAPVIAALLLGNQVNSGAVQVNTVATFGNEYMTQVKTPVLNLQLPGNNKLSWQGMNTNVQLRVGKQQIDHIKMIFTIGAFAAQSNNGSILTKEITVTEDITPSASGLWDGTMLLTVPEIIVDRGKEGKMMLQGLGMNAEFDTNKENLYRNRLKFSLDKLAIPNFTINTSNATILAENFSADALLKLIRGFQSGLSQEQRVAQYDTLFPQIYTTTSQITENAAIDTSDGKLVTDGQIQWFEPIKTMEEAYKKAKVKINVRVSAALVNKLIELSAAANKPADNPAAQPAVDPNSEAALLEQVERMVVENKMSVYAGVQLKDLIKTHLAPDIFANNVDQYVVRKEITTEIAKQIEAQYVIVQKNFKNTAVNAQLAAAPPPPQPTVTPAEVMKQQVEALVKQGYLTHDKDDYVATLTVEEGVAKANGIVIEAVNAQQ